MKPRCPRILAALFGVALFGAALIGVALSAAVSAEVNVQEQQVAALDEMARAVSAGEAGAYARLYAADAVITIYGSKTLEGRAAIEAYEVELLRQFPGVRLAFYDVWQQGPVAVVHYAVNGPTPGGQSMGHEGLLFYRFAPSGLITEERRYNDSLTPMAQLGALGPGPARPLPTLPGEMKAHVATGSARERDNLTLVKESLVALDAKNEAMFLSTLSSNVTIDEMIDPQPVVGRHDVKAWFERWAAAVPDARTEVTSLLGAGDFVVRETVVTGMLKGPIGRLVASNKAFVVHRAMVVEVKKGRIVRITAFMNGKELAEATGQWPLEPGTPDPRRR